MARSSREVGVVVRRVFVAHWAGQSRASNRVLIFGSGPAAQMVGATLKNASDGNRGIRGLALAGASASRHVASCPPRLWPPMIRSASEGRALVIAASLAGRSSARSSR